VGSEIEEVGSRIRRVGSGITALGSEIKDHAASGSAGFLGGQGHTFGIKDQKFACKIGISKEKNIPCYHPVLLECLQRHRSSLLFVYLLLFYHYAVAVREDVTFST